MKNFKFIWSSEVQIYLLTILNKNFVLLLFLLIQIVNSLLWLKLIAIILQLEPSFLKDVPTITKLHLVAFFSWSLSPTEKNYAIYNKELLAILSTFEHWRHLLKDTSTHFTIFFQIIETYFIRKNLKRWLKDLFVGYYYLFPI